jgi:hypothetical protein
MTITIAGKMFALPNKKGETSPAFDYQSIINTLYEQPIEFPQLKQR